MPHVLDRLFAECSGPGSSVLEAILAGGEFTLRAVSRKPDSNQKSCRLNFQAHRVGLRVVQADLNDVESLKKALAGSEGVFLVSPTILERRKLLR